ncbi:NAD(P)-binding domain-containing protein [Kribbella sp. HUAS MG21]|uniref:NAD(P)-binding domain-containing protein n=1 Tax=Kribbella sp. HUAS MG21 TaxID=3160966 RepID=A0AAU7TI98_9ACTN
MTVLLNRSTILRALDIPTVLDNLRAGFTQHPEIAPQRVRTDLPGPGTATTLLPGLLPGIPAYTVKVNAKFPTATPALRGIICLHDLTDGTLLAILDSTTLTAWRTGLSAALATNLLAPHGTEGSAVVGVVGAGVQAGMVVRGLDALGGVEGLVVCDVDRERAAGFLGELGIPGVVVGSAVEVVGRADVVVLATWSREPLLGVADVRGGVHLTTLGADEPGKVELSAELLRAARVVVDDRELAVRMGALGNVGLGTEAAHATLSEVLTGRAAGRSTADEITVYAPVGLPWQDLAIAWPVYQSAKEHGATIDFLG